MIEVSKAFEYETSAKFPHFDRVRWPRTRFAGLMQYDGDLKLPAVFLVPPPAIDGTAGEFLAKNGLRTFVCSETQKFGVSGFGGGGVGGGGGGGGGGVGGWAAVGLVWGVLIEFLAGLLRSLTPKTRAAAPAF